MDWLLDLDAWISGLIFTVCLGIFALGLLRRSIAWALRKKRGAT